MLRWLRQWRERNDRSLVKKIRHSRTLILLRSCAASWGSLMRLVLTLAAFIALTSQATKAEALACNNRSYVNSSGLVVHSPLLAGSNTFIGKQFAGELAFRFQSTDAGHARIMAWHIGNDGSSKFRVRYFGTCGTLHEVEIASRDTVAAISCGPGSPMAAKGNRLSPR